MNAREFFRFHLLKVLMAVILIQLIAFAIFQNYNHRPVANRDETNVIEGRSIKIAPLLNDADKNEFDELALANVMEPLQGTIEITGNFVNYTPITGFTGIDSFSYKVSDGKKLSKPAWIVINVLKNAPPEAKNDSVQVYAGNTIIIDVLSNDTDPEGDSLFIVEHSQPLYGKLKATGNRFVYLAGTTLQPDSFSYTISDGKNHSAKAIVYLNTLNTSLPLFPWYSSDVGDVTLKGETILKNGMLEMQASGSDIWNNFDGFRYTYQHVAGNCEIVTKVEQFDTNHEWGKAGVMLRELLHGGSKMAFICSTIGHGININQRAGYFEGATAGNDAPNITAPCWLKLSRKDNLFIYSYSKNGTSWVVLDQKEINMPKNVYAGFAVTSHNNAERGKAVFSQFKLSGKKSALSDFE